MVRVATSPSTFRFQGYVWVRLKSLYSSGPVLVLRLIARPLTIARSNNSEPDYFKKYFASTSHCDAIYCMSDTLKHQAGVRLRKGQTQKDLTVRSLVELMGQCSIYYECRTWPANALDKLERLCSIRYSHGMVGYCRTAW